MSAERLSSFPLLSPIILGYFIVFWCFYDRQNPGLSNYHPQSNSIENIFADPSIQDNYRASFSLPTNYSNPLVWVYPSVPNRDPSNSIDLSRRSIPFLDLDFLQNDPVRKNPNEDSKHDVPTTNHVNTMNTMNTLTSTTPIPSAKSAGAPVLPYSQLLLHPPPTPKSPMLPGKDDLDKHKTGFLGNDIDGIYN